MKRLTAFVLCLMIVFTAFSVNCSGAADETGDLTFKQNGKFRILHLTDTQDDAHPAKDLETFLRLAIEGSKPDLIVFTGDLVEDSRIADLIKDDDPFKEGVVVEKGGEIDIEATTKNLEAAADFVLGIFEEYGVPFVIAQGNNDHKCGITNEDWLRIYSKYPHCIIRDDSDDPDGGIDYNVIINGTDGQPKFNIWLTDTGRNGVNDEQIEWYKNRSAEITRANGGTPVPAFLFQHIFTNDLGNLFVECSPLDYGARAAGTGFYKLNPETAKGYASYGYEPCEPSDQFKAWKECGDIIGAYFGHSHVDGFSGTFDGIELGITYGAEFAKPGPYGYRIFELDENDITNYTNDVYTYKGGVAFGNARFELQTDERDFFADLTGKIIAFFLNIPTFFEKLFKI